MKEKQNRKILLNINITACDKNIEIRVSKTLKIGQMINMLSRYINYNENSF